MKHESLFWIRILAWLVTAPALVAAALDVADWPHWDVVATVSIFVALITTIALKMPRPVDESWLPIVVVLAFFIKLLGAGARWFVLVDTYEGAGDAFAYHNRALNLADVWRRFQVPDLVVGSSGTTFTSKAIGLVYAPYEPSSILGGFFIFATLAFIGQLFFYAAFRHAQPDSRLKLYAVAVLMLPSIVFWPSSIGKESLMILFIGFACYGVAKLYTDYRLRWVPMIVAGTAGAAAIRLHVAALLAATGAVAMFLARRPVGGPARTRRFAMVGLAGMAVVLLLTLTSETFGIDPDGTDLDPFLDEIQRRTQQGGSAVEGEAVQSVFAIPDATLRVLFRPLPNEATSIQAYLSAFESVMILGVLVWRSPKILRSLRRIRSNPYLLFSMLFVIGFIIVFSAIFNLGILARQRTQALPFLLAVIVGLGWPPSPASEEAPSTDLVRTR